MFLINSPVKCSIKKFWSSSLNQRYLYKNFGHQITTFSFSNQYIELKNKPFLHFNVNKGFQYLLTVASYTKRDLHAEIDVCRVGIYLRVVLTLNVTWIPHNTVIL